MQDRFHITHYTVEISYSYSVDGEFYSGYHDCGTTIFESRVDKICQSFPKGALVMVRVNPRHSEQSFVQKW